MALKGDITFPKIPSALEKRVRKATKDFLNKKISDVRLVSIFFRYFFQRIEPMYKYISKKKALSIKHSIQNQIFAIIVPKLVEVTINTNQISNITFTKGTTLQAPAIIPDSISTILNIILGKTTIFKAYMEKTIIIRKISKILKWIAPITVIQTEEIVQKVKKSDFALIDSLLSEVGY